MKAYFWFLGGDEVGVWPSDVEVVFALDGSDLEVAAAVEEGDVAVDRRHRNLLTVWRNVWTSNRVSHLSRF